MRGFLGLFALALTISGLVAHPAAAADRTVIISEDSDYFGFDLRTEQNVSLKQCEASCIGDQACRAFTYNPKAKWCFLKSDFNQLNNFVGAVAGRIVTPGTEPDIGAPPRLPFVSEQLAQDSREAKENLSLTEEQMAQGMVGYLTDARNAAANGQIDNAIAGFKASLAIDPDNVDTWLELSRTAATMTNNSSYATEAMTAAVNGYELSRTRQSRADALAALALAFERAENYRPALTAYKESLALVSSRTVQAAYQDLRERRGFRVVNHTIDADGVTPRACVEFSEPLVKSGVDYSSYVTLDGAPPQATDARGSQICVEGLRHGQRYRLSLRAGLPSSVDENLEVPADIDLYVKDRAASVRFTGDNFVLPSSLRRAIPLVSVNIESAQLKLYRIGDRGLAPLLAKSQFLTQLAGYDADEIEASAGELVWQGAIEIASELNKDITTSFPVDEALPQRKPGVYVLTAALPNKEADSWDTRSTQWFVVSDIGLSTYTGTDGLNVFARSLGQAGPMAGVELQLLAKNNEVLGTATTDSDGRATFSAGLVRGSSGLAPAVLTAKNSAGDYVFLDMTRAGFDLSDRGVTGRAVPGAVDVFAWTERGVYRAGETVHAAALARDGTATAVERLPLTFVFLRPDGVEDRRMVGNGESLGGYAIDLPLQANAMRGTWTMRIFTDPERAAIAEKQFLVDDFVPDRTEFEMSSEQTALQPDTEAVVEVKGRYLYGAPAAGLSLESEISLKPTRENPAFPRYQFGLADEGDVEESQFSLDDMPVLDEEGAASFSFTLDELPATTRLLNADVTIRMIEAGGRAVERKLTLPVLPDGPRIGVKPEFSGDLAENSVARFHVIAIDPEAKKQAMQGLIWKLYSLERNYQWYRDGSSWRYETVMTSKQVADGKLDISADGAEISTPVGWGRYRLEVESAAADGPATSVEFDAGWYVAATSTETPDGLEIGLDKDAYAVGETAKLKVSPRFAGELLVTIGTESLISVQTASIPLEGGEVDIPVTSAWGAGAYVTATLFKPAGTEASRMPSRAIGVKWAKVDPADRKLSVTLSPTEKMRPRQPLEIPIEVKGAGVGDEAYVTVAAVDVGILNLTRYEAPDPDGWYFGQRRLGLEIRDIYGRLIDGSLGALGRLRTGGDGGAVMLQSSPPTEKLVAFFSGPVKLDQDGKAVVSFDIPQFNGTARVMAVAWSKQGVGHASTDVIIRDPVVVTASMPKFLAPADDAQLLLEIANTDGAKGDYTLQVTPNKAVAIDTSKLPASLALDAGAKTAFTLPLTGMQPGSGAIEIALTSASGERFDQTAYIPVRPAALPVTTRRPLTIAAGSSLTVDGELLADSILQDAEVSLRVARADGPDIPALLMSLDRYPYGCAEQTTSRALPLLYMSELSEGTGITVDDGLRKRIQDSIYRVLSYQSYSGSFGLWSPGSGDLWLDSYVTDFLTRARELKYDVPEEALVSALDNLQNVTGYDTNIKEKGDSIAYALYVLARNRKSAISDLRYYADTLLNDFPTPLAKAHIAAALSLYGDTERARKVYVEALGMTETELVQNVSLSRSDYGSNLRDSAAILALAAESRPVPPVIPALTKLINAELKKKTYTSTQEQAWMLLAARALQQTDNNLKLDVNGAVHTGNYTARIGGDALLSNPVTVTNRSSEPVSAIVTTVAAPSQPLAAGGDGFEIERTYYSLDGEEVNVSEVQQNERYVAVLSVTPSKDWASRILITDLLPAGFEIDNPSLVDSARLANFEWLGDMQAAHLEFRSDRFVAAFDRAAGDNSEITLAYVVRAVTPGTYDHPAAVVEDMYRPQFSARTATGRMEVTAAQ